MFFYRSVATQHPLAEWSLTLKSERPRPHNSADEVAIGIVDAGGAPALLAIGFRKKSYSPRSA